MKMLTEIGSNFWLNPEEVYNETVLGTPSQFGCSGSDYVWMSTGRSATRFVLKTIEERNPKIVKRALLPPFTCHTVIDPFIESGWSVVYYDIDFKMNAKADDIIDKAIRENASVVLFHRYFGFNTIIGYEKLCEKLRLYNIISIEDITQCLYSSFAKTGADYIVGSIRKWVGTPDGGFAVCRENSFTDKPLQFDSSLEKAKLEASYLKYRYLFCGEGDKFTFLEKYKEAEDILDNQYLFYSIGRASSRVQANIDIDTLREKRRKNYNFIYNKFPRTSAVYPILLDVTEDVTPLYLPVFVEERNILQSILVANSIYAPVVWPKPEFQTIVCEDAEKLYEHILCIPIDQRYDEYDMRRILMALSN